MLTKERTGKTRKLKYAAVALALLAVLVFCFASCGKATPVSIEYVKDSATKVVYNPGETFDCTGAQVKVTYEDGAAETVAVTPEMVGTAPLALGVEFVSVTYSENGATVVGHIPVTVVDPNADLKTATIDKLAKSEAVVANKTDAGVALLLGDYSAKIKAATTADAVAVLEKDFVAALEAYLADKEAVIAKFDGAELVAEINKLYAQFRTDIETAKKEAIANIKAASTLDEANDYFDAFKIAVANKLAEQNVYVGGDGANGQIKDKIALLYDLEDYLAKIAMYEEIVEAAKAEIGDDNYNTAMALYAKVRGDISYQTKYITLAIDLGSVDLKATIGDQIVTNVDKAVAKILEAKELTILPTGYKADGTLDTENDAIAALLDELEVLLYGADKDLDGVKEITGAVDMFGVAGVDKLLAEYGKPAGNADADNYFKLLKDMISDEYDYLNGIRVDAETIIAKIDAAAAETSTGIAGDPQDLAIQAAWDAIKTWNTTYKVFTMTGDGTVDIWVTYGLKFADVVYTATGFDGEKWTTIDETWTEYDVDKAYVVKYFIPNIDKLFEASQARYAAQVMDAINKLDPDSVVHSTTAIDSKAAIENAEYYYNAFRTAYVTGKGADGKDDYTIYNKYFADNDANGKADCAEKLAAARTNYDNLVDLATKANLAIGTYMVSIGSSTDNIKLNHFADGVEFNLKDAYTKYLDFAEANGAVENAGNPAYTDVITNRAELIAYVKHYNDKLAYVDQRNVESAKTISAAWIVRDDKVKNDAEVVPPAGFRDDLQKFYLDLVDFIQTDAKYNYVTQPTISYYEGEDLKTLAINDANEEFYLVEILKHNVEIVNKAAQDVADYIAKVTYTTDFTVNPLVPNP